MTISNVSNVSTQESLPADPIPVTPVDGPTPEQIAACTPTNTIRRLEQPRNEMSEKTREALRESNMHANTRRAEEAQARRDQVNERAMLEREVLKDVCSTNLSLPA